MSLDSMKESYLSDFQSLLCESYIGSFDGLPRIGAFKRW